MWPLTVMALENDIHADILSTKIQKLTDSGLSATSFSEVHRVLAHNMQIYTECDVHMCIHTCI